MDLKIRRDELARDISEFQKRMASGEPALTPHKIAGFAKIVRKRLEHGTSEFKQAYVRLLMRQVTVTEENILVNGSTNILAKAAWTDPGASAPPVLSFVRDWLGC